MSKARVLADFISDGSTFADGAISVAEVSGAAPLASPTFTGTASGTFSGPLTGNVTGNVTGDLTGDVTGNVAGNLTGNVTGDLTGDIDLNAISATIADTAVDIFVYDTRKDSDGGAWRKRTQHTSWYNETLNTATRGSRKEFPAVAVIVAESDQVTIYDGDDPDLPMWMVFNPSGSGNNTSIIGSQTGIGRSLSALNGQMCVAADGAFTSTALHIVNFISDGGKHYTATNTYDGITPSNIANRNALYTFVSAGYLIVSPYVNDVAMTVLPNAPIDAATGLPVPTIAVATEAGMSFIKDDGTVVDLVSTNATYDRVKRVEFSGDDSIIATVKTYDSQGYYFVLRRLIPTTDDTYNFSSTGAPSQNYSEYKAPYIYNRSSSSGYVNSIASSKTGQFATGINEAGRVLSLVDPLPEESKSYGMVAGITSDYNTGWMNGNIKLATLSDTDATNVTGSELVTNGDFSNGTTGWTAASNGTGTTLSASNNQLTISSDSTSYGVAYQNVYLEAGKTYVFTVYIHSASSLYYVRMGIGGQYTGGGPDTTLITNGEAVYGWNVVTYTPTTSGNRDLQIGGRNDVTSVVVSDVSIREAEEDRSVNGNGLQVFGTVTKSAVATGADLVAYSVGGASYNYLAQPVNDDLDFGTGDWSATMWAKTSGTATRYLFSRFNSTAGIGFGAYINTSNGHLAYWFDNGPTTYTVSGNTPVRDGSWHCLTFVRRGGTIYIYIDGKLDASNNIGSSVDVTTDARLVVLNYENGEYAWQGEMSLFRISATAPSPQQILKIYNDEKVLFQDGAKAVLAGTSDAVTSLAYDDDQQELLVGTSQYTSVFRGLRRVEEISGSASAISASNGLRVIED